MALVNSTAQTFFVNPPSGIFVTSVELFFQQKDDQIPITVQLRPFDLDSPSREIYPFGEVVLNPENVNVSENATVPTKFTFESPVYLAGDTFHCLVVSSTSDFYIAWSSKIGDYDITGVSEESLLSPTAIESLPKSTKQPNSGGLFKSQNGFVWSESINEDLKYNIYRANFTESTGNVSFYNPELSTGNSQIATLLKDSLELTSKRIRVGLGTTVQDTGLTLGNTILQDGTNGTGNYVGAAGSAFGTLTLVNSGIGYTPSDPAASYTFNNVVLSSVTGSGTSATANLTVSGGVAIAATIVNGGFGYVVGDVLSPVQVGVSSLGLNAQFSVSQISGVNTLIIDQVQGSFETGIGKTVKYVNNSGVTTYLNSSVGGNVLILNDGISTITDGLHIKVNHKNHGMYATENSVVLSDVISDIAPTDLIISYDSTSNSEISIQDATNFTSFENVGISSTNPGYILIEDEIISYEGVSSNTLTGITRGIDSTIPFSYTAGTKVFKYELSGVSLRRINKQHILSDATTLNPIDLDHYTIKVNTSDTDYTGPLPQGITDRSASSLPNLFINDTKSSGGSLIKSTQNIQYELIRPVVKTLTLSGTGINASVRTVSGRSVDGSESSFLDQGFQDIDLNSNNYFSSPRIVCSEVNENTKLPSLPGNKSFTLTADLFTFSSYISPVIDLERVGMVFTTNRVNNPILNYAADDRVSTLKDDPSSFVYATEILSLENAATSIKVLLSAHVNAYSDLRVLYSLVNETDEELIYYPFPGYVNKKRIDSGLDVDDSISDGTPDEFFTKTDIIGFESSDIEFRDYEFTIDNLASFRYFSIKIIGSSTNQAYPPRIKNLRIIALA